MRQAPGILHLDMDAFYASVEQVAKPSLAGKAVIVGGIGARGVVATASYEARVFGVRSAMSIGEARRRCPNAAFLSPRFGLYRQVSDTVMELLHRLSPLVEPLSLDEAFIDLEAGPHGGALDTARVTTIAVRLRADIHAATGLTCSVGAATSKLLAKIASEADKPDGLCVVAPGTERAMLDPLPVRALPGVGPATGDVLRRAGLDTVAELAAVDESELVRLLGQAHGHGLHVLAAGLDARPVVADRDAKSVSVEDTFATDLVDRERITRELDRLSIRCVERLRAAGRSGRTIVLKLRRYDFSTLTRSETLRGPTDDPGVVRETIRRLAAQVDVTGGVRLLGVGVSGLADFAQQDLFGGADAPAEGPEEDDAEPTGDEAAEPTLGRVSWSPGQDVVHEDFGPGWVQGSGVGRVTVRFEVPGGEPGRVRTFALADPALRPGEPLPLPGTGDAGDHPSGPADPGAPAPPT
ncbi:DNA polymerase IV [Embleya hyalina]|nr:DNA polymerase IV [Embleya hyalina]